MVESIKIDEDIENSDWTKQSYDLPVGEELEELLLVLGVTETQFKKLPAYYLSRKKTK